MAAFGDRDLKRLRDQLDAARVAVAVAQSGRLAPEVAQHDLDAASAGLAGAAAALAAAGSADEVAAALAAARADAAGAPVVPWQAFVDRLAATQQVHPPSVGGRRFCTRCGAAVEDGARFCDGCGSPVTAPPGPPPTVSADAEVAVAGKWRTYAVVVVVVVVVGVALAMVAVAAFAVWLHARGGRSAVDEPVPVASAASPTASQTAATILPTPTPVRQPPDRATALRALLPAAAMGPQWRESAYVATDVAPADFCGTGFTGDEGAVTHVGRTVSRGSTFVNAQVAGFGPGGAEAAVTGYVRSLEACTEYHNTTFDKDVRVTRAPQRQAAGDTAVVRAQVEFRRPGTADVTLVVEVVVLRKRDLVQVLLVSASPPGPGEAVAAGAMNAAASRLRSAQP